MRAFSVVLAMVLCLCTGALGVDVNVGNQTFPLEAVKELKELMDLDDANPQLTDTTVEDVCAESLLPQVFDSVCQEEGRETVFSELVEIFNYFDPCEICSFAACTGCLD